MHALLQCPMRLHCCTCTCLRIGPTKVPIGTFSVSSVLWERDQHVLSCFSFCNSISGLGKLIYLTFSFAYVPCHDKYGLWPSRQKKFATASHCDASGPESLLSLYHHAHPPLPLTQGGIDGLCMWTVLCDNDAAHQWHVHHLMAHCICRVSVLPHPM